MISVFLLDLDLEGYCLPAGSFIGSVAGRHDLNLDLVSAPLELLLDSNFAGVLVDRDLLFAGKRLYNG